MDIFLMDNASWLKFVTNRQFNLAVKTLSIIHFSIIQSVLL